MSICQCQWIGQDGLPTPDDHPAIGMVVCYDPISFGEKGCEPFLICLEHAKRKGKFWKLLPLPGQALEASHEMVKDDSYYKPVTDVVIAAIKKAWPDQAKDIFNDIRWSGDHFSFNRWGMYVGVELDGLIHT